MKSLSSIFRHQRCNIIGMLHLPALPGTPGSRLSNKVRTEDCIVIDSFYLINFLFLKEILEHVEHETSVYVESGVDGLILENMHDTPYCHARDLEPHITASMAVVAARVRELVKDQRVPVGVQGGLDILLTLPA